SLLIGGGSNYGLFLFVIHRPPPAPPLFPYTTLFRSGHVDHEGGRDAQPVEDLDEARVPDRHVEIPRMDAQGHGPGAGGACGRERSEEHTSELQSRGHLVCRLLLEKKKTTPPHSPPVW